MLRDIERRAQDKVKSDVIFHYSNGKMCCSNCGYSENINALVLDHINDDGKQHREKLKNATGCKFYYKLRKSGFPSGLQVLCANCNTIKQIEKFKRERI